MQTCLPAARQHAAGARRSILHPSPFPGPDALAKSAHLLTASMNDNLRSGVFYDFHKMAGFL